MKNVLFTKTWNEKVLGKYAKIRFSSDEGDAVYLVESKGHCVIMSSFHKIRR